MSALNKKKTAYCCVDCGWLDLRVDFNGRSNYWCGVKQDNLEGSVIWKKPCRRFAPAGVSPVR